jgi:hypothetical protein
VPQPRGKAARSAGYSGTPLTQKLGIRTHCRLYVRGAPADYAQLIGPLPAGAALLAAPDAATDLIHLFSTERAELAALLRALRKSMRGDAAIWVSWPKKSSGVASELTEDVVRELALPLQLVDVKVCAVDATWSALKLVLRKAARPATTRARPRRAAGPR